MTDPVLFELGPHRVVLGDCLSPASWDLLASSLPGRIDLVVTSPPYASRRKYDPSSGFRPVPPEAWPAWVAPAFALSRPLLSPAASWFLNVRAGIEKGRKGTWHWRLVELLEGDGWRLVDELCWRNTGEGVPGRFPETFKNAWESVFHLAPGDGRVFFAPRKVGHRSKQCIRPGSRGYVSADSRTSHPHQVRTPDGGRRGSKKRPAEVVSSGTGSGLLDRSRATDVPGIALPSNVLELPQETKRGEHPAPFPVELPARLIRAYSPRGGVVVDPFGGSGSTLIAAASNARVAGLIELSPGYVDGIRRRWGSLARKHGVDPGSGAL